MRRSGVVWRGGMVGTGMALLLCIFDIDISHISYRIMHYIAPPLWARSRQAVPFIDRICVLEKMVDL
jgi:hypothetical protein